MDTLEDVLRKVRGLIGDLSANLQEAEGYYEESTAVRVDDPRYDPDRPSEYFVETKKAVPNPQKREAARQVLRQIFDSSEWYSVKYIISHSVGNYQHGMFVTELPFPTNLDIWTQDMRQRMIDPKKDQAYRLDVLKDAAVLLTELRKLIGTCRCDDEQKLTEFFEHCYANNPDKEIRTQAARYLDHHAIRIWAHEHPFSATLAGVAAAGAASGIWYLLAQYFSK